MTLQTTILLLGLILCASCERVRQLQNDDSSSHYKINCKNFDEKSGTCIECFEGCTKWENICVKVVKHCAVWDDMGNCTTCEAGYGDKSNKAVDGACPKQKKDENPVIRSPNNET